MFPNLLAEMARNNVSVKDIQRVIGVTSRTARDKISGAAGWTLKEALEIRDVFFPAMKMDYLFERPHRTKDIRRGDNS